LVISYLLVLFGIANKKESLFHFIPQIYHHPDDAEIMMICIMDAMIRQGKMLPDADEDED
jgi:hypothetical protein